MIWNPKYATGIKEVDEQHKVIFHLATEIQHAKKNDLLRVLEELIDYATYHFATEERFFAHDPAYAKKAPDHVKQHNSFIDQIRKLDKRLAAGMEDRFLIQEIRLAIAAWANHIVTSDQGLKVLAR